MAALQENARYAAIRQALTEGKTYAEISREFHVSTKTIAKLRSCDDSSFPRGRPKVLTPEVLRFIEVHSLNDAKLTDGEIRNAIHDQLNIEISRSSVATARNKLGFKFRPPMTRQVLSETQREERLEFSHAITSGQEVVPNIIFSDESRFEKHPDNTWRRIKRGAWNDSCFAEKVKFNKGVMVWAAIGVGYRSPLMICECSVDSVEYRRLLEASKLVADCDAKYGRGRWTLMQDGAPAHLSAETMAWFRERHVAVVPGWPANSPDLNPIENLWAIMKRQVKKHQWTSTESIQGVLQRIWAHLDETMINKLVLSFGKRCLTVASVNGGSISQHLSSHRRSVPEGNETPIVWSSEDDERVIALYEQMGPRWNQIGRIMNCRPITAKYHWRRAKQRKDNEYIRTWEPLPPIEQLIESA